MNQLQKTLKSPEPKWTQSREFSNVTLVRSVTPVSESIVEEFEEGRTIEFPFDILKYRICDCHGKIMSRIFQKNELVAY